MKARRKDGGNPLFFIHIPWAEIGAEGFNIGSKKADAVDRES
jgi:hypothetical protein